MKLKKIISRKDHEIYFIPMPNGNKTHMTQKYVLDTLNELHPGFSANSNVDIKSIFINKKRWFMATVIANEILAEYRIMYRNALFYTNTSILAHEKLFSLNSPAKVDNELIGFDSDSNIPVSIPLDIEGDLTEQSLSSKLRTVPLKCSVFKKRKGGLFKDAFNRKIAAVILTGFAVLLILSMAFNYTDINNRKSAEIITEFYTEQPSEIIYLPSAISILAHMSEILLAENGKFDSWRFNEGEDVSIYLQCSNISAYTVHTLFNQLEYITLQNIQNVNYSDDKPQLSVEFNKMKNIYSIPVSQAINDHGTMFAMISELTESFKSSNIEILSEILPSGANNNLLYAIYFSSDDKGFIDSMRILEEFCGKLSLRVKELEISFEMEKNAFLISCVLYHADLKYGKMVQLGGEKESIPLAFGYKPAEIKQVNNSIEETPVFVSISQEVSEIKQVIGSITDFDGKKIFFYGSEGKITMRSEQ